MARGATIGAGQVWIHGVLEGRSSRFTRAAMAGGALLRSAIRVTGTAARPGVHPGGDRGARARDRGECHRVHGNGSPIDMFGPRVSTNAFRLLGVAPMLGRDFVPADEDPGAAPVVILNYRFWESRFSKRSDIVGLTVQINSAPATIVGVMPEGF